MTDKREERTEFKQYDLPDTLPPQFPFAPIAGSQGSLGDSKYQYDENSGWLPLTQPGPGSNVKSSSGGPGGGPGGNGSPFITGTLETNGRQAQGVKLFDIPTGESIAVWMMILCNPISGNAHGHFVRRVLCVNTADVLDYQDQVQDEMTMRSDVDLEADFAILDTGIYLAVIGVASTVLQWNYSVYLQTK